MTGFHVAMLVFAVMAVASLAFLVVVIWKLEGEWAKGDRTWH